MMSYQLSICIPTYNFGRFLVETLDNLIEQATRIPGDVIQVVIVDGGSTDDTAQLVQERIDRFAHIKYIRLDKNRGVDPDILETVEQADSPFCWLLSADDHPADGALKQVLELTQNVDADIFLLRVLCCSSTMEPICPHPMIHPAAPQTYDWSDTKQRHKYWSQAVTTTEFFSFISSVVVRRDKWIAAEGYESFVGGCWVIAAKIFSMAKSGLRVHVIPQMLVNKRGDNDSFMSRGIVGRTRISLEGFRKLVWHFYGEQSYEARCIANALKREYPFPLVMVFKMRVYNSGNMVDYKAYNDLIRLQYSSGSISDRLTWLTYCALSGRVLAVAVPCYRVLKKCLPFVKLP